MASKKTKVTEDTAITAESLLDGLPTDPKDYTNATLSELMKRYNAVREQMSVEEQAKIRAIGQPATKLLKAKAVAEEKKVAEDTPPKSTSSIPTKALSALATEMNGVMSLQPPIDPDADDVEVRVRKELEDIRADDFVAVAPADGETAKLVFSDKAVKAIRALGIEIPTATTTDTKTTKTAASASGKKDRHNPNKVYKPRTAFVMPSIDKLPPILPKGKKATNMTLAFRVFMKAKGTLSVQQMIDGVLALGGTELPIVSVRTYLYYFGRPTKYIWPKYR